MNDPAPAPSTHYYVLNYFHYWPSKGPILVSIVFLAIAVLLLLASTIYTRRWYMLIACGVGIAEIIGFALRYSDITNPIYGTYVAMQCLLIIPPSFLALVGYMTLSKVVAAVKANDPYIKDFLKPKLITWVYFGFEIFSLALQGAGAGLSVSHGSKNSANSRKTGKVLLLVGLAFLIVIIFSFISNAIWVFWRAEYRVKASRNLTNLFYVLFLTTFLLAFRCVFRTVEFAGGFYGSIARQEKYFYTMDTLMICLILIIEGIFNFGFFLNGYEQEARVQPSSDLPHKSFA